MTSEAFEKELWRLFSLLDSKIQETMKHYWAQSSKDCPIIHTNDEHVTLMEKELGGKIHLAASTGRIMLFRLNAIEDSGLDIRKIILHELAHCYLFSIKKFRYVLYFENKAYADKCEKATITLTERWYNIVKYQDSKLETR